MQIYFAHSPQILNHSLANLNQVKNPNSLMYWYLKSKIFIESVINLSICEADAFIDKQFQPELEGNRSETMYQIFDEQAPISFSSLQRMLLDYLQPSAVQLLGSFNECIRRCFNSSSCHVAASLPNLESTILIEPTILRASQIDSDEDDDNASLGLAKRLTATALDNFTEATATKTVQSVLSTSECTSSTQAANPSHADVHEFVAVQDVRSSCNHPETTALCVIEYSAVMQRRWLVPSIVPNCLKLHGDLVSHVSGILKADAYHEYVFLPTVVLPDSASVSIVSFPKIAMRLTDAKGKQLDARELDSFTMNLLNSPTDQKSSNLIKSNVFRNSGYSIRVRQYFLQIESRLLADTYVLWWYMDDSGRFVPAYVL